MLLVSNEHAIPASGQQQDRRGGYRASWASLCCPSHDLLDSNGIERAPMCVLSDHSNIDCRCMMLLHATTAVAPVLVEHPSDHTLAGGPKTKEAPAELPQGSQIQLSEAVAQLCQRLGKKQKDAPGSNSIPRPSILWRTAGVSLCGWVCAMFNQDE